MKITIVVTVEATINAFLRGHITELSKEHDVRIISRADDGKSLLYPIRNVSFHHLPFDRQVEVKNDFVNLLALRSLLKKTKPDLTISFTPKAGFLTALASVGLKIPNSLHVFTGQVWVTKKGLQRFIFKICDWIIAQRSSFLLTDSHSQMDFLISEQVVQKSKIVVLGDGSLSGVDTERFHPNLVKRREVRQELAIDAEAVVVLFVGRLNRDKGIIDLANAFVKINAILLKNTVLVIVGPDEGVENIVTSILASVKSSIRMVGFTSNPEKYIAASDIFCLPSYREGFGTSTIEAAAVGLPTLASRIYGLTDAVVEGETGLLHQAGAVSDILQKLELLITDNSLRNKLGQTALRRAKGKFSSAIVTRNFVNKINSILNSKSTVHVHNNE